MKRLHSIIRGTTSLRASFLALLASGGFVLHAQDAATSPATTPATETMVSNGDFSAATKDPSWPDNWAKGAGITWEAEGGKHFLRIAADKPDQHIMVYREINLPVGLKNLQITIRYRTAGVQAGTEKWFDARAIFHFMNDTHKTVPPDPKPLVFAKDSGGEWKDVTEQCVIPEGATKLVLMPSLFKVQAGTLDLAEISVAPVNP